MFPMKTSLKNMDYEIRWLRRASTELTKIYHYYEQVAGKKVAIRRLGRISESVLKLKDMPYLGVLDQDFPHEPNYRHLTVLDYKIYYFVDETVVYIASIWDCRQGSEAF